MFEFTNNSNMTILHAKKKKPPIVEIGGLFVDYVQLSRFRVRLLQFLFD